MTREEQIKQIQRRLCAFLNGPSLIDCGPHGLSVNWTCFACGHVMEDVTAICEPIESADIKPVVQRILDVTYNHLCVEAKRG